MTVDGPKFLKSTTLKQYTFFYQSKNLSKVTTLAPKHWIKQE